MAGPQNIVGPTVRKLRYQKGWTQAILTARCSRVGWDISENTIAKIEAQIRCVTDREVAVLAQALGVELSALFPLRFKVARRN
jgi:transcriptional regulator with XRE-family HTH domain